MPYNTLFTIAIATLLLSCGQPDTNGNDAYQPADISGLQAQVAAITGKTYANPGTQVPQHQNAREVQSGGQHPSDPPGQQQPAQEQGGMTAITLYGTFPGIPMATVLVPARWNAKTNDKGGWSINAPGLSLGDSQFKNFVMPNSQDAAYMQQAGMNVKAPATPEQIIQNETVAMMRASGYELIRQTDQPEVARADKAFVDQLYSIRPRRNEHRANLSEWRKGDKRQACLMHWSVTETPGSGNWNYYFNVLETTADRFEQEKQALVQVYASTRYNPQYFAAYAQSEQQKAGQSMAAFNQRMRTQQAAFDAQQQTHRETWDAINNASMSSFRDRMGSMDRMQNATINAIRGEQDAYNPYTGESGKVQSGYDNYWMNRDGQYMGTNSVLYNPNVNSDWTDQWREVPTKP